NIFETSRHHTNNREALIVKSCLAPDGRGIGAEAASPKSIAQNRHRVAVELIFGLLEVTAEYRRDPKDLEVAGAYTVAIQPFWLVSCGHSRLPRLNYGD